jgi:hypothetical protein
MTHLERCVIISQEKNKYKKPYISSCLSSSPFPQSPSFHPCPIHMILRKTSLRMISLMMKPVEIVLVRSMLMSNSVNNPHLDSGAMPHSLAHPPASLLRHPQVQWAKTADLWRHLLIVTCPRDHFFHQHSGHKAPLT